MLVLKTSLKTKKKNRWFKEKLHDVNSSNSTTKYINFYEIIKVKNAKHSFAIFNTDSKPGTHWWSLLDIYLKKKTFYYLIVLDLHVLKNLLQIMI